MPVRQFLKQHVPTVDGTPVSSRTCMYTNTPDDKFIIDFHPSHPNIVLVSACCGHGFKFSSAIGEVVQQMVINGKANLTFHNSRLADSAQGNLLRPQNLLEFDHYPKSSVWRLLRRVSLMNLRNSRINRSSINKRVRTKM